MIYKISCCLCIIATLFLGFGPIAEKIPFDADVCVAIALGIICGLIEVYKIEKEVSEIEKEAEKNQL